MRWFYTDTDISTKRTHKLRGLTSSLSVKPVYVLWGFFFLFMFAALKSQILVSHLMSISNVALPSIDYTILIVAAHLPFSGFICSSITEKPLQNKGMPDLKVFNLRSLCFRWVIRWICKELRRWTFRSLFIFFTLILQLIFKVNVHLKKIFKLRLGTHSSV